jgi:hypothetical protein
MLTLQNHAFWLGATNYINISGPLGKIFCFFVRAQQMPESIVDLAGNKSIVTLPLDVADRTLVEEEISSCPTDHWL